MALIKSCNSKQPEYDSTVWIAENATIVGNVKMGKHCSVWFNTVIRGDVNAIEMGTNVNVQDGAVIHCTYKKTKTIIGDYVSIGHNAIVHGCKIHDNVLIGMGSIVMDNCIVEEHVIVAAGAVVTEGKTLESGYIYAGVPAKKIKKVPDEMISGEIERIARNYKKYSGWFKDEHV